MIGRSPTTSDEHQVQVVFHTPVATEYLDELKLAALDSSAAQAAADELNERLKIPGLWRLPTDFPVDLQGYGEPQLSSLQARMPRPLLEAEPRRAIRSLLLNARNVHVADQCVFPDAAGTTWTLKRVELTLWTIGAAMVAISYDVSKPSTLDWMDFADVVSQLRKPAREDISDWMSLVLNEFSGLAQENGWVHSWARGVEAQQALWSEPLWTYNTFLVTMSDGSTDASIADVAASLVDDGTPCELPTRTDGTVIWIGLTSCCATRQREHPLMLKLVQLVGIHTACWGAATRLDSFVSDHLVRLELSDRPVAALAAESKNLLRLAGKVRSFLLAVEGVLLHLRPEDARLWQCLENAWRFGAYREGLKEKLDVVRSLHTELTEVINRERLRHLGAVAFALTAFGVLTTVLAVYGFIERKGWGGLPVISFAFAVVTLLIVYYNKRNES